MEKEIFYMPDGRRGEKRVTVDGVNRVTEIWAEAAVPLKLVEKITEVVGEPVVTERVIEKVDEHGTVLERKVEKTEGDHPVVTEPTDAKKQVKQVPSDDNYVTKEQMVDAIAQAVLDVEKLTPRAGVVADKPAWWKGHVDKPVVADKSPRKFPLTAQMAVQERMGEIGSNPQLMNYIIWGVLIIAAGVALYFSL